MSNDDEAPVCIKCGLRRTHEYSERIQKRVGHRFSRVCATCVLAMIDAIDPETGGDTPQGIALSRRN